jgi:hypothetical protein
MGQVVHLAGGPHLDSWDKQDMDRAAPAPDIRNFPHALLLLVKKYVRTSYSTALRKLGYFIIQKLKHLEFYLVIYFLSPSYLKELGLTICSVEYS